MRGGGGGGGIITPQPNPGKITGIAAGGISGFRPTYDYFQTRSDVSSL